MHVLLSQCCQTRQQLFPCLSLCKHWEQVSNGHVFAYRMYAIEASCECSRSKVKGSRKKKMQIKLGSDNSKRGCTQHMGVFTSGFVWFCFCFCSKGVYPVVACVILPRWYLLLFLWCGESLHESVCACCFKLWWRICFYCTLDFLV